MREVSRNDARKGQSGFLNKIGGGIDNVIEIFSPQRAFKRRAFRRAAGIQASAIGSYRGAKTTRLNSDWNTFDSSADAALLSDLPALRTRSRDLERNDANASGIINTVVCNDVGTGIKPQSRPDREAIGINEQKAIKFQVAAERVWNTWLPFASADNRMDFYEIQALADRQILVTGEFIAIPMMLDEPNRPYSLALNIVDSDRLATPSNMSANNKIRSGVEIGSRGQPIAYWIRKQRPEDFKFFASGARNTSDNFIRFDAVNSMGRKNVIHIYQMQRPGQSRGIPFFAPVISYFRDLCKYMEAELVAARIAACFAMVIEKTDPSGAASANTAEIATDGKRIEELEPGIVEYLKEGEKMSSFNPQRPGGTFEPFVIRILRSISAALGLPYELVAKDFSRTNFSSARAALLEARRFFRMRQEWMARKLNQPMWDLLQEEAFLKGDLPAKNFFENKTAYLRARWITPGWEWVDPKKEAEASKLAMDAGISTLADEAAAKGKDWEENLAQIAREKKTIKAIEKESGVILFPNNAKATATQPPPDEEEEGDEDR